MHQDLLETESLLAAEQIKQPLRIIISSAGCHPFHVAEPIAHLRR